jgi:hypothetical protein
MGGRIDCFNNWASIWCLNSLIQTKWMNEFNLSQEASGRLSKTEQSEILPYLQGNKLVCDSFMDDGRSYKTHAQKNYYFTAWQTAELCDPIISSASSPMGSTMQPGRCAHTETATHLRKTQASSFHKGCRQICLTLSSKESIFIIL